MVGRIDLALSFILAGGASAVASIVFFRLLQRLPDPEDVEDWRRGGIFQVRRS